MEKIQCNSKLDCDAVMYHNLIICREKLLRIHTQDTNKIFHWNLVFITMSCSMPMVIH